jgi:hypothetical protein
MVSILVLYKFLVLTLRCQHLRACIQWKYLRTCQVSRIVLDDSLEDAMEQSYLQETPIAAASLTSSSSLAATLAHLSGKILPPAHS